MKRNTGGKGKCSVCNSADREVIDALSVAGWTQERLAARFKINRQSVRRHLKNHLPDEKKTKLICGTAELHRLKELVAENAGTALETVTLVHGVLLNHFLRRAEADKTFEMATTARVLLDVTREFGKLRGEITTLNPALIYQDNRSTTNVAVIFDSPEFVSFTTDLLQVCLAHPEVRPAIAALLRKHASGGEAVPAIPAPAEMGDAA